MSLVLRLRRHLHNGFCKRPIISALIAHILLLGALVISSNLREPRRKTMKRWRLTNAGSPPTTTRRILIPRSPPTPRVFRLVDEVSSLTLVEVAELASILMKKMQMKDLPSVGYMEAGAAGLATVKGPSAAKEEKKAEKTVFELKLESYKASAKIKEVRSFTDLGLKEAKELVEKAPAMFKAGVSKEEGQQIIEKMKALGAKVVME